MDNTIDLIVNDMKRNFSADDVDVRALQSLYVTISTLRDAYPHVKGMKEMVDGLERVKKTMEGLLDE